LKPPSGWQQADWVELLASYHYLHEISKYNEKKIRTTLKTEKNHLVHGIDQAKEALEKFDLLSVA